MVRIQIVNDKTIEAKKGTNLMDVLIDAGCFIENPCNGMGTCGKCKVRVLESDNIFLTQEEKAFLSEDEIKIGIRLSCFLTVEEELFIELLGAEKKHEILTYGHTPDFTFAPKVQTDNEKKYGVAVDIGTTTVVASLIDMIDGNEVASASQINPQKKYGLDVLTRISYAFDQGETGKTNLQMEIVKGLNGLISSLADKGKIKTEQIIDCVISANTTMLHFLLGVDARGIGRAPYEPVFTKAQTVQALSIGIHLNPDVMLYCLPSVSSYIGSDIVSGCYAAELNKGTKTKLFIDIGTNGEIVLADKGKLFACSCAAGPALEGMNISSGVRAQEGAIEEITFHKDGTRISTIANKKPTGLCGSGILAAFRELLSHGLINERGAIVKPEQLVVGDYRHQFIEVNEGKRSIRLYHAEKDDEHVGFQMTQSDIRQVQLSKGAILSGLLALTNEAGVRLEDLDEVIVAGQFGAHLSVESLVGVGIVPKEVKDKITYLGNTSKSGAYMALMSEHVRKEMEVLSQNINYLELANTNNYERVFANALLFKGLVGKDIS